MQRRSASGGSSGLKIRLLIGVVVAVISIISYFTSQEYNPVTGEKQYVGLTTEQEIALGQQSVPEMVREFGGLAQNEQDQARFDEIGFRLVNNSVANTTPWVFDFHVLANDEMINAFALPGGQVFITMALYDELVTDDQLAGVLAHEIVHVLARHSAQRIAKSELTNGLVGAVGVASGEASAAQTAAVVGQLINMQYGRDDEIESDTIGVCLMVDAGYDPEAMITVMEVLAEASDGARQPEFFSTHPNPDNRIEEIEQAIEGIPEDCPSPSEAQPDE